MRAMNCYAFTSNGHALSYPLQLSHLNEIYFNLVHHPSDTFSNSLLVSVSLGTSG